MAINLGNIIQVGEKTVASGITSGIDTAALIEQLSTAKRQPATDLEDILSLNSTKVTKFGELRTILETFKTSVDFLRSPPGINNFSNNIFEFRNISLFSSTTVDAATYLSATAAAGATIGDFDVQIGNLAQSRAIRSNSFSSLTDSAVEAASGSTSGLFSAGTFTITGDVSTATGDKLASADYTTIGSADNVTITTLGIHNYAAPTTGGSADLQGVLSGFSATAKATDLVDITVTVGTTTFTASDVDASFGGTDIQAGTTITFTDGNGTSFDVITAANITIDEGGGGEAANLAAFETALDTALAGQSVYQDHELGNFKAQTSGIFDGFARTDALFTSNNFNSDGTHGALEEFSVTAATTPGGADGIISVVIDGETYQATGLGNSAVATTAPTDTILTADYSIPDATITGGTLTTAGINNITAPTTGGNINLMGVVSGFSSVFNDNGGGGDDTVDLSVTINGSTFTAAGIAVDQGGGLDEIAAGAITFTDSTGTTFDINLAANYTITNQTDADQLATDIDADLDDTGSPQAIYQSRELGNFDINDVSGTIAGLTSSDVKLTSDGFDITDFTHGTFSNFTVTNNATDDNDISVTINGELYQVLGVANDPGNVTLVNQVDNNKTLTLNFADAGVTLDLEADFATIEDDLDTAFNVDRHSADITLVNQTDNNKTLQLDLSNAGVVLDLTDSANAAAVEVALDQLFDVREASVTLNEGDNLNDVAAAINSQSGTTKVSASIIQVSDTDFRLTVQSDNVGTKNTFTILDGTPEVVNEVTFNTLQSAEDSLISVDGIEIKRTTNVINDVITGITFNLLQETPDYGGGSPTTVTATTSVDTSTANSGVVNFVNEFNNFRVFAATQTAREAGTGLFTEDAVLGSDTTLNTLIRQIQAEINRTVSGVSNSDFNSISDAGITLVDFGGDAENPEVKNILTFDPAVLDDALLSNFGDLREIFEYSFNSTSNALSIFARGNNATLTDYKLDIDTSRSNTAGNEIIKVTDTSDNFLFAGTLSNGKITFADGTELEGTELLYTGDGTDVITVSTSQGIGDSLFNILDEMLEEDGTLDSAIDSLADEETRINEEIVKIDAQVDIFRDNLLIQFTSLEAAIARANTLLDFLDIQAQSIFGNN